MFSIKPPFPFTENLLLASLNPEERARLRPHLERVKFPKSMILCEIGDAVTHAYFITSGIVSLLSMTADGDSVQVAVVGHEGVIGVPIILRVTTSPYWIKVQIPCTAVRLKAEVLNAEFGRGGKLQDSLLRYLHSLITHITQSAICNRYHSVEQRFCRSLLVVSDSMKSNVVPLTQLSLADMVGAQRTGVTMTAIRLQRQGIIRYCRGTINIIDRHALELSSCECYQIIRDEIGHFLAA